jgi:hypothetical protein
MKKQGHKSVRRAVYNGLTKEETVQDEQDAMILVPDFGSEPTGHVTVGAQIVKNLGNYESARVHIELSLPTYASQEEQVRVYSELQGLVTEMMNEQLGEIDNPVKAVR